MKIYFQSTEKNSKEYDYRSHEWDLTEQLDINEYLSKCCYGFEYGGYIDSRTDEKDKDGKKVVGYKIKTTDKFKNSKQLLYLMTIELNYLR